MLQAIESKPHYSRNHHQWPNPKSTHSIQLQFRAESSRSIKSDDSPRSSRTSYPSSHEAKSFISSRDNPGPCPVLRHIGFTAAYIICPGPVTRQSLKLHLSDLCCGFLPVVLQPRVHARHKGLWHFIGIHVPLHAWLLASYISRYVQKSQSTFQSMLIGNDTRHGVFLFGNRHFPLPPFAYASRFSWADFPYHR